MSRIGAEVALRTPREIYEVAQEARRRLFVGGGRLILDMEYMLEKLVQPQYDVVLDVRDEDDPDLAGAHAAYDVKNRVIRVRQSVMIRCMAEDPDAIFTICHELGHVCMHADPVLFRRRARTGRPGKYTDPEWQADRFAMEFAVDRTQLERYGTPASAAVYFRMPEREMRAYFSDLRAEGILSGQPMTQMDKAFEIATQEGFDF